MPDHHAPVKSSKYGSQDRNWTTIVNLATVATVCIGMIYLWKSNADGPPSNWAGYCPLCHKFNTADHQ
ncbi:unnamed protein product [Calypogeia fissa]